MSQTPTLHCTSERRREAVRAHTGWNGLDFVEVDQAQTTLTVYFLGKAPQGITAANLSIEGGRTPKDAVRILSVDVQRETDPRLDDRMLIHVDKPGDYSTYTLRLIGLEQVDERYSSVDFSFKSGCPSDLDCAAGPPCSQPVYERIEIDYLAKDYASFRQLILDRLSLIMPDWRERHVPDLGITLVEILAYVGDYLSYYQDAVATEAYLNTARRRTSVRRHARLVNYFLSEGTNARAFVAIDTGRNISFNAADVFFITGMNGALPIGERAAVTEHELASFAPDAYEVFEPVERNQKIRIWKANNILRLYTWGNRECCLCTGSTTATIRGELAQAHGGNAPPPKTQGAIAAYDDREPVEDDQETLKIRLAPGSIIVFEEVIGPRTGNPADADPWKRHAVRLTKVTQTQDALTGEPVIAVEWSAEDALPFELCLSAQTSSSDCAFVEDITIARGNIVLVDHGRSLSPEPLGIVPLKRSEQSCDCEGRPADITLVAGRFRPRLQRVPLTFRQPVAAGASARALLTQDARRAEPAIWVESAPANETGTGPQFPWDQSGGNEALLTKWAPQRELIASGPDDHTFVVEMEEDGTAFLLFGNGETGAKPRAGEAFRAHYRIGRGVAGNVGAGAISILVHRDSDFSNDVKRVRNPLAASGGTMPEPMAEAKLNAPYAFRFGPLALQRAITASDYAELAGRNKQLQRAAARLVWTGSWFEAEVGVDPLCSEAAPEALLQEVELALERYRRVGHDLDVRQAEYVPIMLGLEVCVKPDYLAGQVKAALLDMFSNRVLPGNRKGFFHPDRLSFGDDIYLSAIIAAAQSVTGVASVQVTQLHRQFSPPNREIENGLLPLGPFEIAQLDQDPNYPDRGQLQIDMRGGRQL